MEYTKLLGKVTLTCDGLHDSSKEYDRLCLVYDKQYKSFISIKEVPANISLLNESYWLPINVISADGEDITVDDNLNLKFANKDYTPSTYSGLGRKMLRKRMVGGKNVLNQSDINKPNTIYIILYEFDLLGNTIEIPTNSVLKFEGGKLINGNVVLDHTLVHPQGLDIKEAITGTLAGTFKEGLIFYDSVELSLLAVIGNNIVDITSSIISNSSKYNWIKYSANPNGIGMTDEPQPNTLYLGIANNEDSPIPSSDPTRYKWSKIKGDTGLRGADGKPGERGEQGPQGKPGSDGKPGEPGIGVKPNWTTFVFKQADTIPAKPTFTSPQPGPSGINGWFDGPGSTGKWWMSKGLVDGSTDMVATWSDPVQCTGEDGLTNSYVDFKYAKSASADYSPSLNKSERFPAGWSDVPPIIVEGEFSWMITALIDEHNNLVNDWTGPFRITGEKGNTGEPGQGEPGVSYNTVFAFTSSEATPVKPVGGTWDPITNAITYPDGWFANDEKLIPPVWISTKTFTTDPNVLGEWSEPIKISGKDGEAGADGVADEFIYRLTLRGELADKPETPESINRDDYVPAKWTDNPLGVSQDMLAEWVCVRSKKDKVWSNWTTPALWSKWGANGLDGDGIQYIFQRTATNSQPLNPTPDDTNTDRYQLKGDYTNIEYVPDKWTDNPKGVTEEMVYEWVCQRKYTNSRWQAYTGPSLWSKYGKNGLDGLGSIIMDLDNEVLSVATDSHGNVLSGLPLTTTLTMFYGTIELNLTDILLGAVAGVTATADRKTGLITVTAIAASTPNTINIPIRGTTLYNNEIIERTTYLTVNKIKPGADGEDAILYQLVPSASSIHVDKLGEPDILNISCGVKRTQGTITTMMTELPSNFQLKYIADDKLAVTYKLNEDIPTSTIDGKLLFTLYLNGSTLVDKETIYKVRDGEDGKDGESVIITDFDNDMHSVGCNFQGQVVSGLPLSSTFNLYYGSNKLTLDELVVTPVSGVTVLAQVLTGVVTVTAIADSTPDIIKLNVTGKSTYKGILYVRSAFLTINKVRPGADGENAIIYSLLPNVSVIHLNNEGATDISQIKCDILKIDGSVISNVGVPSGCTFTYKIDDKSAVAYVPGTNIAVTTITKKIYFELKKTANAVVLDSETIYIVKDGINGQDGESNVVGDLDNDMQSVACDVNGNVTFGLPITTTFSMYYGTKKLVFDSLTVDTVTGVTSTADKTTGLITVSAISNKANDVMNIPVTGRATNNGIQYTLTAKLTITKVKPGKDGEDVILYSLLPSTNSIHKDKVGTITPANISCKILKRIGETITETSLPSGYSFVYRLDTNTSDITYTAGSNIATTFDKSITFELKKVSDGTIVDRETIYIVKDGTDGEGVIIADLSNEMSAVACNAEGLVLQGLPLTTEFNMYYGYTKLTLDSLTVASITGVTATANPTTGLVTVTAITQAAAKVLNISITGKATTHGLQYAKTVVFTVTKVLQGTDGSSAIIYQLLPSTNAIHKDASSITDPTTINCKIQKTTTYTELVSLPAGHTMYYKIDGGSAVTYTPGTDISTSNINSKIVFTLEETKSGVIDQESIPVVKDGINGVGSINADIDNEMAAVACNSSGTVVSGLPITTTFSMYYGTDKLVLDSLTLSSVAGVTTSTNSSTGVVTISAITAAVAKTINIAITGKATYKGTLYSRVLTFTINKIFPGVDGSNAIIYLLNPSVRTIHKNKDGVSDPSSITCGVTKTDGSNVTNVTTLPTGYSMVYVLDSSMNSYNYTIGSALNISFLSNILFALKDNNNNIIDKETIWIVKDGEDGEPGTTPNWYTYVYKQASSKPDRPLGSDINPSGWYDYPTNDGQWWQCIGLVNGATNKVTVWSEVLLVNGKDGDALTGDYTEFRFAKSSNSTAPSISVNDRYPSGWNTTPPTINVSNGETMWMTSTLISPNNTIRYNWSAPVRISGENGNDGAPGITYYTWIKYADLRPSSSYPNIYDTPNDFTRYIGIAYNLTSSAESTDWTKYAWTLWRVDGQDGEDGQPGKDGIGKIPYPAGTYFDNVTYTCTRTTTPYVIEGTEYYVMIKEGSWLGTNTGLTPSLNSVTSDSTWILMEKFDAVFTKLLIADGGTLGKFVFSGDYMFSQLGKSASGEYSEDFKSFGYTDPVFNDTGLWEANYRTTVNSDYSMNIEDSSGSSSDFQVFTWVNVGHSTPSFKIKVSPLVGSTANRYFKYKYYNSSGFLLSMDLKVSGLGSTFTLPISYSNSNTSAGFYLINNPNYAGYTGGFNVTLISQEFRPNFLVNANTGEAKMNSGLIKASIVDKIKKVEVSSMSEILLYINKDTEDRLIFVLLNYPVDPAISTGDNTITCRLLILKKDIPDCIGKKISLIFDTSLITKNTLSISGPTIIEPYNPDAVKLRLRIKAAVIPDFGSAFYNGIYFDCWGNYDKMSTATLKGKTLIDFIIENTLMANTKTGEILMNHNKALKFRVLNSNCFTTTTVEGYPGIIANS